MKKILKYKSYLILTALLLFINLILSIIYLNSSISYHTISVILIITMNIYIFCISYLIGYQKNINNKRKCLKTSIIITVILLLLKILFKNPFKLSSIVYYLLIFLSSFLGLIIKKRV